MRSGTKASWITLRKVPAAALSSSSSPAQSGEASRRSASLIRRAEAVKVSEHGVGGVVNRSPPGGDLVVRFLSGQPLRGEEPGLVGRDGHEAADGDRPVVI
jgi:hypothetical protein